MQIKIPYIKLSDQWQKEKKDLLKIIDNVLKSGNYVGGDNVDLFEKNISKYTKSKYTISLNSGTDALTLGMHLLGISRGDEVITPPNSFIASTACIVHIGAKPVFVDVLKDQNIDPTKIEKAITKKTKAIMAVHLTGRVCDMISINRIAKKYNLLVIEDSAQAIGSKFKNKMAGTFGNIGCFSSHPLKNLNSCGDGGFIITNNKKIYSKAKLLRNHGLEKRNTVKEFGYVSRMDNLQAAILNYRLKKLNTVIKIRRKNAKRYFEKITAKNILLPFESKNEFNTYHTFVIQTKNRDKLKKYLMKNGVEASIHYPIPIHLQPASKIFGHKKGSFKNCENQSKTILTLPIHQYLKNREIDYISNLINGYSN